MNGVGRRQLLIVGEDRSSKSPLPALFADQCRRAEVDVLSFWSASSDIERIIEQLRRAGATRVTVIDDEGTRRSAVERARKKFVEFVATWPDSYRRGVRTFKELFLYEGRLSLWWLLELSEKNPEARGTFRCLCAVEAVREVLRRRRYDLVIVSVSDAALRQPLCQLLEEGGLRVGLVPRRRQELLSNQRVVGLLARRLFDFIRALLEGLLVRLWAPEPDLGPSRGRRLAFHTIYPGEWSTMNGTRVDRYYLSLLDSVSRAGVQSCFVANVQMVLNLEGSVLAYVRSLGAARRALRDAPRRMDFLERHVGLAFVARTYLSLSYVMRYLWLERTDRSFRQSFRIDGLDFFELFRRDLRVGFLRYLPRYLLTLQAARRFARIREIDTLVLYQELYCWRRALIYGVKTSGRPVRVIGYQNSTVTSMQLYYVYVPGELVASPESPDDFLRNAPVPDEFALQGERAREILLQSGFRAERLHVVGSPRFDHFARVMAETSNTRKREVGRVAAFGLPPHAKIVAVAGAWWRDLTERLVVMTLEALGGCRDVAIVFAAHPDYTDGAVLFREVARRHPELPTTVWERRFDELIPLCDAYVGVHSMTAAEALVLGCPAIMIRDGMLDFSPLADLEGACLEVRDSRELARALERALYSSEYRKGVEDRRCEVESAVFYRLDGKAHERFVGLLTTGASAWR